MLRSPSKRLACGSVVAGVLVAAGIAWPSARQQDPQPPGFRSTVDVVRVETTVLDKDRHPIRGLRVDDFSVLENGQQRPVVAFAPVDLPRTPPSLEKTTTAGTPQGFTGDHARLRAAINQPFAVALTDPHPDRSKRIIDPEGYTSGECLCGLCTLDALTQLGQTLRTVSQQPKVVLFISTYVRTFEAMRPTAAPPNIPAVGKSANRRTA